MTNIQTTIAEIKAAIPAHVCLVAVSKTKPKEAIEAAYAGGQRHFGENKVQELVDKYEVLPKDIQWHMIGHLQSNKVKYIAPFVHLIHAVDSIKLLQEIDKQAVKNNRVIDCLLQMHIAEEETKFGFSEEELRQAINENVFASFENIRIVGLMGMATFTENTAQITKEFASLKQTFDSLVKQPLPTNFDLEELSMGMSGDYELAIQQGSTMVRIGSTIFGERNYTL